MPELQLAAHYEAQTWDAALCTLCPHQCSVASSRAGRCGVRKNRNGDLYAASFGRIAETLLVGAEELPMFHFHPGSKWYRAASIGCTMSCRFCNTWKYSQVGGVRTRYITPRELVQEALQAGADGIAFGGNEPAVWHEFILEVGTIAHESGLLMMACTSGMWATEPFSEALECLDAIVFGLKGFDVDFWSRECGGLLEQTRLNIEMAIGRERHVETTYLVIEGETDKTEQVREFTKWMSEIASKNAVHLISCKPDFQWTKPAASPESLLKTARIMSELLPFVYGEDEINGLTRNTKCPSCKRVIVTRSVVRGVTIQGFKVETGSCAGCGTKLPIMS